MRLVCPVGERWTNKSRIVSFKCKLNAATEDASERKRTATAKMFEKICGNWRRCFRFGQLFSIFFHFTVFYLIHSVAQTYTYVCLYLCKAKQKTKPNKKRKNKAKSFGVVCRVLRKCLNIFRHYIFNTIQFISWTLTLNKNKMANMKLQRSQGATLTMKWNNEEKKKTIEEIVKNNERIEWKTKWKWTCTPTARPTETWKPKTKWSEFSSGSASFTFISATMWNLNSHFVERTKSFHFQDILFIFVFIVRLVFCVRRKFSVGANWCIFTVGHGKIFPHRRLTIACRLPWQPMATRAHRPRHIFTLLVKHRQHTNKDKISLEHIRRYYHFA